jgi:hypothetical protein
LAPGGNPGAPPLPQPTILSPAEQAAITTAIAGRGGSGGSVITPSQAAVTAGYGGPGIQPTFFYGGTGQPAITGNEALGQVSVGAAGVGHPKTQ